MSKCLITGGAGFIGSHVADLLIEEGHEITIVDNLSSGKIENLASRATFLNQDIEEKKFWDKLNKFDYVFHLAAFARISPSVHNPTLSHNTNLNGTLNVLEYCRLNKAKLIFSSSSSIYSDEKLPTTEDSSIDLDSPYTLHKFCAEKYIELYHKLYGLDHTILRYFSVFGPRQLSDNIQGSVVGILLKQKSEGAPFTITNDGEQRRDFVHVKDVARANIMAMDWPPCVVNIGTGKNYSINELVAKLGGEIKNIGPRLHETRATLADNSKARSLGWMHTVDIMDDI